MSRKQRQGMIDREHRKLSLVRQCILLRISWGSAYYRPASTRPGDLELMNLMDRQNGRIDNGMHRYLGFVNDIRSIICLSKIREN